VKLSVERKIVVTFGAALLLLVMIAIGAAWNALRFDATFDRVDHTYRVLADIWAVQTAIPSMQSSARGFLLTGDDSLLEPYRQGRTKITGVVQELRTLTADNPRQIEHLARLDPALADAIGVMESHIAARRARDPAAAHEIDPLLRGQRSVGQVRAILDEMDAEERRLMTERVNLTRRTAFRGIGAAALGGVLALALIALAGLMAVRNRRARDAAEEALRQSEASIRQMFESIKDYAIFRVDPLGRVASWGQGAAHLLGYQSDEILGQHIARFYPADAVTGSLPLHELRVATETGRYEDEGWRVRRDGSRFWANVVLSVIRDSAGELVGFVKVTRDLSARRATEEEIRSLNHDLQRQNDNLAAANRELESFSYSVSHDLRAPLRHIDGFATLLSKHADIVLDETGRRYLSVISDSARRMGRLIDDLLSFSRMGRAQMECVELDHHQLVSGVLRESGHDRNPRIEWHVDPLPRVRGDAAMLRQVWTNLIDNAVKYSARSEHPRIEIGRGPAPQGCEQIFYIRDNGVGFDMKYSDKLFGVFQRLHRAEDYEGTGVGLAIVQRIVHRHGGRVWAEAAVDRGATFYFTLKPEAKT